MIWSRTCGRTNNKYQHHQQLQHQAHDDHAYQHLPPEPARKTSTTSNNSTTLENGNRTKANARPHTPQDNNVSQASTGGATGAYSQASGDVPTRLPQSSKQALPTEIEQPRTISDNDLLIFHKNARGLTTNERIDELHAELNWQHWDAVLLNETMHNTKEEFWITKDGHFFCGSGHHENTYGVAILLHERWWPFVKTFVPVNERVAYLDLQRQRLNMRLASTYLLHNRYKDQHVQRILNDILRQACNSKTHIIIGADCNARAGTMANDDDPRTVGCFGAGPCKARGQWLKNWASTQDFVITNTFFQKQQQQYHTYVGPNGIPRQIDYILYTLDGTSILH